MMGAFVRDCLLPELGMCAVDRRVREAKPSRKYTRAEVLAMLDEIDPEDRKAVRDE